MPRRRTTPVEATETPVVPAEAPVTETPEVPVVETPEVTSPEPVTGPTRVVKDGMVIETF